MPDQILELSDVRVLVCDDDGPLLESETDASGLIGAAWEAKAGWVAVPAGRFSADFWRLSTRLAGGFIQKFVTYRVNLAIVGAPPPAEASSAALAAFIVESNRGRTVWFVEDLDGFREKLGRG